MKWKVSVEDKTRKRVSNYNYTTKDLDEEKPTLNYKDGNLNFERYN